MAIEDKNLKENLRNVVTKTKEKLENDLSYSINDRINKGIKIFKNKEEKSIIKILSYVSKISQTQNESMLLLGKMIKI